jgi:hypothetical protein
MDEAHQFPSRTRPMAWLVVCAIAVSASGCARARATVLPAGPPLDVPAPPPRIVIPVEVEVAPPPEPEGPVDEPRRPAPRPRPPAPPPDPPRAAEEPPRTPPPAPPPATTLQTTPVAEQDEAERAIRTTMTRASGQLSRIDYRALNANARTQYDTAKRFVQQAEEAIRGKNLPFAKNLADKAATLAAQLAAR